MNKEKKLYVLLALMVTMAIIISIATLAAVSI